MPRLRGQIDTAKQTSVFDAAIDAFTEKGLGASLEEIARRAGVSRQTIYNQFGSKSELVRALVRRRVDTLTAPLKQPGAAENPEATLTAYGETMLNLVNERSYSLMRMTIQAADDFPELALEVYQNGPAASRAQLAAFLEREDQEGRLRVERPNQAAEFFVGLILGNRQTAALLRLGPASAPEELAAHAAEAAKRFVRAYSV